MSNEILDEIRKFRDEHAKECGYDIRKISQQIREGAEKLKAEGWVVVYPKPHAQKEPADAAYVLREEPSKEQKQ